jgi:hypothetical protein
VPVSDNAVGCDKKTAASRQGIVPGIKSFDSNRRRFDAFYKLRQEILRGRTLKRKKEQTDGEETDFVKQTGHYYV